MSTFTRIRASLESFQERWVKVRLMRPFLLGLIFFCAQASAQAILKIDSAPAWAQIVVKIDNAPAVFIGREDLTQLGRHTAILNDHGNQIRFEGVLLADVLQHYGVDLSKPLRGARLASYVAAIGSDGYEAVYALAELDPTLVDGQILIADRRDGAALKPDEGPLRLIAPHDKRGARSVKMLHEIDIVQLRK